MYDVLVLIHILSAMVWVGGGFVLIAAERHAYRSRGQTGIGQVIRQFEWTDNWIFTPAPLLVIATGVTMVIVSDAWAFSQPWVYLALGLIVVEFITGSRELKQIKEALERGEESPRFGAVVKSYLRFSVLALAMLVTIVYLMVFKPGA